MIRTIYIISLMALFSCNGCKEGKDNLEIVPSEDLRRELILHNKRQHEKEIADIKAYIQSKGWSMTETATGLQYMIIEKGEGPQPKLNDYVGFNYTVELLDGTKCYSSEPNKPGIFKIGEDNVESGLHELALLLHQGDKAIVVIPSHLAFGLTGDSSKIPQSAPLVYSIELMSINP